LFSLAFIELILEFILSQGNTIKLTPSAVVSSGNTNLHLVFIFPKQSPIIPRPHTALGQKTPAEMATVFEDKISNFEWSKK